MTPAARWMRGGNGRQYPFRMRFNAKENKFMDEKEAGASTKNNRKYLEV
jgi:hypothetical protein